MREDSQRAKRRSVLKKGAAIVTATTVAGCSSKQKQAAGGDGGDGGDGSGSSGSKKTTQATGPKTFTNKAGVEVGANYEAVKELAKEEGSCVLYTTADREVVAKWSNLIQEDFPFVTVSTISGNTSQILPRWLAEYSSGNIQADFMITSSGAGPVIDRGQAMPLSSDFIPNYGEIDEKFVTEHYFGLRQTVGAINYNHNMVEDPNAVTSFNDLVTNDRWSGGKIGWDPSPSFRLLYGLLENMGGPDSNKARTFLKNLKAQEPAWVDSHSGLSRQCAAGKFPVTFTHIDELGEQPEYPMNVFKKPAKFSASNGALINNKANNPNQALLFTNYMYSDKAQKLISQDDFSVKYGLASMPKYVNFSVKDANLKVIPPTVNTDPHVAAWNEVMGELSAY